MRGGGRWHQPVALACLALGIVALALAGIRGMAWLPVDEALARPEPGSGWEPERLATPSTIPLMPAQSTPSANRANGYLRASGAKLIDASGHEVRLTGLSWFGLETANFAPHGLWARNWQELLDAIAEMGFNALRLPFSNQLLDSASKPNGIDFQQNGELIGLSGLDIMDRIVAGATARGLRVVLDRHRPDASAQSELWYTDRHSEERWIADWQFLARRYRDNTMVVGADVHNEPHGAATWGDSNSRTDWRLAAERVGNAILAVNPDWLILVEGIDHNQDDYYWWGGSLQRAREFPVRLNVPGRLVYSPHDYGPGVYNQRWFLDPSFPGNLPGIWDRQWGYLAKQGMAPILLGEFGGRSVGKDAEGQWQRALVAYLRDNEMSYAYWTLNPNSGDTGGLLKDDWRAINQDKLTLLKGYQWPR